MARVRTAEFKAKHAIYMRTVWYPRNKAKHIAAVSRQQAKVKALLDSLKEGRPCADCGRVFPPVAMDWDHIEERGEKYNTIANLCRNGSVELAIAEIKKCELVCAVCHRIRTHTRKQHAVRKRTASPLDVKQLLMLQ